MALLAAGSAAAVALIHHVAVITERGQRWDEQGRGRVDSASSPRLHEASGDLLATISVGSLALAGGLLIAIALMRGRIRLALGAGVVMLGANLTTQWLKRTLPPPELTAHPWADHGSLPSGHATVAMSLAVVAVMVAPQALRPAATLAGALYASGVAVAVIALDWHRPSDSLAAAFVVAGWCGAAGALLTLWPDREDRQHRPLRHIRAWSLGATLAALAVIAVLGAEVARNVDLPGVAVHRTTFIAAATICTVTASALLVMIARLTGLRERALGGGQQ